MINSLFKNGSHTDLTFADFIRFAHNIFKDHASPGIPNLFFHPRGLRAVIITVFSKQNTDIWLKAFKIHVLKQVTKHIEKLQCGGVVEQLCRSRDNQNISSAYNIYRTDTKVGCAVDNYHVIIMSDSFNGQTEHQVRVSR